MWDGRGSCDGKSARGVCRFHLLLLLRWMCAEISSCAQAISETENAKPGHTGRDSIEKNRIGLGARKISAREFRDRVRLPDVLRSACQQLGALPQMWNGAGTRKSSAAAED